MARPMKDSGIEWIGKIPDGWKRTKLLYALRTFITDGPHETPELIDSGIPFISIDSLNDSEDIDFNVCKKYISEKTFAEYSKKAKIEIDDILFTKAATIGKTAIVKKTGFMVWSPIAIIKVNHKLSYNKYIYHLLNCTKLIDNIKLLGSNNTQINVGMKELESAIIPLPPVQEQQRIASFLDSKCQEIDNVLAKTRSSIEEYKKLKQAIITKAVTKGIRNNRKMKDSGIEWIGEIPEEWDIIRIGHVFTLRNERNKLPMDEVQLLSLYSGKGVFPTGDEGTTASGNHAQTVLDYKIVKKDDIVVNIILAWMGSLGVSKYNGVVSPAYDVYIPNQNMVSPRFYHYVFRTDGIASECYRYGRGIMMMRWRTYSTEFKRIVIPFPCLEEQNIIANYLDTKCVEIDTLISKKEQLISELETYKKSLIYEYVTGKKEVPMA